MNHPTCAGGSRGDGGGLMVVLPRLHLVRATGAVNRLEKLLHHLSPPWW